MALDRAKLHSLLAEIEAGSSGMAALYARYLDRLPLMFGSTKLAAEADLVLAALAAAELAHAEAARAVAPVAFEPDGADADGNILFRPTEFAPAGVVSCDWRGVPLYALAVALGRARERRGDDDEAYTATFIYVLFRLKAALGVWRGDTTPDARYRLWLKDLAPAIGAHPRLGPLVRDCHRRIADAVIEECTVFLPQLEAGEARSEPPAFAGFALTALQHSAVSDSADGRRPSLVIETLSWAGLSAMRRLDNRRAVLVFSAQLLSADEKTPRSSHSLIDLARAYTNRGNAKQAAEGHGPTLAIADYDQAIALTEALRRALEPHGQWTPTFSNDLASAYMNRANVKQDAKVPGLPAAIADYDTVIALREALRRTLEPQGRWDPALRNDLAAAYMNRGNAKQASEQHGPDDAIADFDASIDLRTDLRLLLEPQGGWYPALRDGLASAYMNRGLAKRDAEKHGMGPAIADYDQAVALREALRQVLEPHGQWDPALHNHLAHAYMNRGNAKQEAEGYGPAAAIADYNAAIPLMEALRRALEPYGQWNPALRNDLAKAYTNRGNAKQTAEGHDPAAAIVDYEEAITLMQALRRAMELQEQWNPELRNDLANAYMNRGAAKCTAKGYGLHAAIADLSETIDLREALRRVLEPYGRWHPALRNHLAIAYMNRGVIKQAAEGYGPTAAIADHDAAVALEEALRRALEPHGQWDPALRNDLAKAYLNRGNAKQAAEGHGPAAAIADHDAAIALMQALRRALEPHGQWDPALRNDLAHALLARSFALLTVDRQVEACRDAREAAEILTRVGEHDGRGKALREAAQQLVEHACGTYQS